MESSFKTSQRRFDEMPVLALVAIFSKQNEPILLKNYLCDYLEQQVEERSLRILKKQESINEQSLINETTDLDVESKVDLKMIKQKRMLDVENTRMQMAMIAYSSLDTFDEKQKVNLSQK